MSIYGKWLASTISAGEGKSSAIDLGREYDYLSIQMPHVSNACKLHLQVAEQVDDTYYDLGKDTTTDVENFGRADVWRLGGYRFVKVVSSMSQDSDWEIRICGMRY